MKAALLLVLCLALSASSASADAFASSDLHPLLRISAVRRSELPPSNQHLVQEEDTFISRGGGLLSQEVTQIDGGPFINAVVRGVGRPAQLAALKTALVENQVGTLENCELGGGGEVAEPAEVTWYGREGRRNSFLAVSSPAGTATLPSCPGRVRALLAAIQEYRTHVVSLSETEVLVAR